MAGYVAAGMKILRGVTGLAIFGVVGKMFVDGSGSAEYLGVGVAAVALALAVGFVESALS